MSTTDGGDMSTTPDTHERTESERDYLNERAYALGADHGCAAASWCYDGNTPREWYAATLQGLRDGDPTTYDTLPSAPLSGEYADDPTPASVLTELELEHDDPNADDLLSLYEDGFGVAVADAIEAACIAALEDDDDPDDPDDDDDDDDPDDDAPTIRERAGEALAYFADREREDGSAFVTLTDEAPEWARDLVHTAHADMLPDDWRYLFTRRALEALAESDYADEARDAATTCYAETYSHVWTDWLGSHSVRFGYVDEAREQYGFDQVGTWKLLARGMMLEAGEVFDLVEQALSADQG